MNKLIVLLAVGMAGMNLVAAQCSGLTQKGERCKREAAEGSSYCIGHADQAKAKAAPKEKDDGTCWALTEAGKRCKHKKDGESDYCKQHAPSVKPAKAVTRCRAMTYDGKQCVRKPIDGNRYCSQHGGK